MITTHRFKTLDDSIENRRSTSYMQEYIIFGFDYFYPSGGLNDLIDIVDCKKSLINVLIDKIYKNKWTHDCIQVFDKNDNKKVFEIKLNYDKKRKIVDIENLIVKKWCDLTITIIKDELKIVDLIKSDKIVSSFDEEIKVNTVIDVL